MTTALYPDLHDAARAARRLRDRHLRRAGALLAADDRPGALAEVAAAAAAELEDEALRREAVA